MSVLGSSTLIGWFQLKNNDPDYWFLCDKTNHIPVIGHQNQLIFFLIFFSPAPSISRWISCQASSPIVLLLSPSSHRVILVAEEPSILACFQSTALLHRRLSLWACYRPTGCSFVFVELRSEIMGQFIRATFPFIQWLVAAYSHSEIEVAWVDWLVRYVETPVRYNARSIWKDSSTASFEPRSPRTKFLRSERSSTVLAGPGSCALLNNYD